MLGIGEIEIGVLTLAVFVTGQRLTMIVYRFQQFYWLAAYSSLLDGCQYPFHLPIATNFTIP